MPQFCEAVTSTGRFTSRLAVLCEEEELTPASLPPSVVHRFPAGRLLWARDRRLHHNLEALIRDAAIVHIHGLWREYSCVTSRLCRKLRKPYLVSAHGMLQPWALANGRWMKRAYLPIIELPVLRNAVGLRALTRAEIADYQGVGLHNPMRVIPNGVEIPKESFPRLFLETFPSLSDHRLVLFLGRIHPKKGIDLLCRAWARVERSVPDAHLVIAGPDEGATLPGLIELVRKLDIVNRVTFTGMLRGPLKWSALAASSLFVLPSHSEGFSMSVLEALGVGLPVLISRNCHFPEIVSEGCGWEIEVEEEQLADSLVRALTMEPGALARMAENGRRLVQDHYTWAAVGNRAADMLEEWAGISERAASSDHRVSCGR
jgi:glycosyltransferase involved in cell wall biosynthesis